jgi:alpha-mannosidase
MPEPDGPPQFTLARAELRVVRPELRAFWEDARLLSELLTYLPADDARAPQVRAALVEACAAIDLDDVEGSIERAQPALKAALAVPSRSSTHRVSAVGHAHLDTAWLWPLRETVRKCGRTFSTAVSLMDDYPEYRFACSQAVHLAWTKQHYPELFERIRAKVATGQFEPTGSMWVEPDCNLPGGESLVRQLVYGKRFFLDEFGIETRDAWLPDVFGFTAALPQILRRAGVDWFLTQKLSWNQYNVMPHHSFLWEGIDGSRVFAHFPPADTYGGNMTVDELRKGVDRFLDHGIAGRSLYP